MYVPKFLSELLRKAPGGSSETIRRVTVDLWKEFPMELLEKLLKKAREEFTKLLMDFLSELLEELLKNPLKTHPKIFLNFSSSSFRKSSRCWSQLLKAA